MRLRTLLTLQLAWLGRQGTRAVAALVVLAIAFPGVGASLKPYVTEAVFVLLCISFARLDAAALSSHIRRPGLVLAATAWTSIAIPLLFAALCLAAGLNERAPELFLALLLQGIASPMMAAPALAALMGLNATLVLATLITSTSLIPITAAVFATLFLNSGLTLAPLTLAGKLTMLLGGAAAVGWMIRRAFGTEAIQICKSEIDGINIIVLFVFVAAVMGGVGPYFLQAPIFTIALTVLAFATFIAVLVITTALFLVTGRQNALALGFMAAQRNMGLMLAATGGAIPEASWLYFAVSQFPIYLSPQILRPLARRIIADGVSA